MLYMWIKPKYKTETSYGQIKRYKKCTLFLSQAPTHHSFNFNSQFNGKILQNLINRGVVNS